MESLIVVFAHYINELIVSQFEGRKHFLANFFRCNTDLFDKAY